MSDIWDDVEEEGLECPNCHFTQTEESKQGKGLWFCFLCGTVWNPEEEEREE